MSFISAVRTQSLESPMIRQFVYLAIGIIIGADESLQCFGPIIGIFGALLQLFAMFNSTMRNLGYGLAALMIYAGFLVSLPKEKFDQPQRDFNECQCTGIVEQVKRNSYSTRLLLRRTRCQQDARVIETEGVMITLRDSLTHALQPGDIITAKTKLTPVMVWESPLDSDYPKYLLRKKIFYSAKIKNEDIIHSGQISDNLTYRIARSRQHLLNQVDDMGMDENTTGVLKALLFGDTEDIPPDVISDYAASGTIHVLAVSGMHVALIYMILAPLFKHIFKRRKHRILRYGIPILILWCYAGITGFSASVMRASTMFSLMLTAAIAARKPNGLNVLFGAGWLMCVVDASTLFDLGFQLSFSAVGGILTLEKKLRTSMELKSLIPRKLWEMSSVSIAAQIGTMPVALFYFHQFPLYFLPANLIIVPMSTLILYGGIISFTLTSMGLQFNIIKEIVAFLLKSMNILARTFSDLPYSVMDEIYLDVIELCCFTICVILIIRFLLWKSQRAVLMTAVALFIIEINSLVHCSNSKPMPHEIPYRESKVHINNLGDTLIYSLPHDIHINKNLVEKIKRFSSKGEHKIILIKSQKFQHELKEYVPQ